MNNKLLATVLLLLTFVGLPLMAKSSAWKVIVSIADQKTYIYKDSNLVRTAVCSTGIEDGDNDTPLGDYILNESGTKRGKFFYSKKVGEGARYWVGFIGGVYLFHSVPVTEDNKIIATEAAKLGTPASHGCVRLSMDDAKWFYETVPDGAKVHIQKESYRP
jgi:lipoprotein-anchoring transpeptidase ErfK/SrfK